jgi:hypothetical protein
MKFEGLINGHFILQPSYFRLEFPDIYYLSLMKNYCIAFSVASLLILFSCNEYKKKEIIGTWTPTYSTISMYGAEPDTMDFDGKILTIKKDKTYEWTGWLNPGEWALNKDNSQISFKAEDGSGEMLCNILTNNGNTLEFESASAVGGTYHMLFTK